MHYKTAEKIGDIFFKIVVILTLLFLLWLALFGKDVRNDTIELYRSVISVHIWGR